MKIKAQKVSVKRNETFTAVDTFPLWEVSLLRAIHNEVEVLEETTLNRAPPVAAEEYMRLENRYRHSTDDNGARSITYVAAVYGQHDIGLQRLQEAIDKATVADSVEADGLLGEVA